MTPHDAAVERLAAVLQQLILEVQHSERTPAATSDPAKMVELALANLVDGDLLYRDMTHAAERVLTTIGAVVVDPELVEACHTTMRTHDDAALAGMPARHLMDAAVKARLALANSVLEQLGAKQNAETPPER